MSESIQGSSCIPNADRKGKLNEQVFLENNHCPFMKSKQTEIRQTIEIFFKSINALELTFRKKLYAVWFSHSVAEENGKIRIF